MDKAVLFTGRDLEFPLKEGLRKQVWWHALELKKQGFNVEIRCFSKGFKFSRNVKIKEGIKIVEGNISNLFIFETDILHIFDCPNPYIVPLLKFSKYKRAFITMTDGELCRFWESRLSKASVSLIKKNVNKVFVQTNYQKNIAKRYFRNIVVLPPLISNFKHTERKTKYPSILFMSHFSKDKGIYLIVEAFKKLQNDVKDVKLIMSDSGIYRKNNEFYKYIKKLNNKDIIIKGPVEPQSELSKSWLYVYPFLKAHNTFSVPLTLFECAQTNTPFVCSDVGGISQYADKRLLAKPSPNEFYRKMLFAIKNHKRIKTKDIIRNIDNKKTIKSVIGYYKK